jgi:glutamate-5-semialdehyde dehydrogenase
MTSEGRVGEAMDEIAGVARAARRASGALAGLDAAARGRLLIGLADALVDPMVRARLRAANDEDLARAAAEGAPAARAARLALTTGKLDTLVDGLRQLAALPELVGAVTLRRELDEGLLLERVVCPLGVLGVVFEARPDAVPQIAGLAIKSGNAILLKGGSEALASNRALVGVIHGVLAAAGLPTEAVVHLERREDFSAMLALDGLIDLVIARGSGAFVEQVIAATKIPVMGHAAGLCHVFLHASAAPTMAARIVVDAKCSYPAACNSVEVLLWEPGAEAALDACVSALQERGVELRGCAATLVRHPGLVAASEADWATEFGGLCLAIRQVEGIEGALAQIERYGSRHTEAIVAADPAAARRFLAAVDAAGVFHNASTRFADGYRYGLGAEVGISTGKLHARGPVGVEGLLTYRWLLRGEGQISSEYGPGGRVFLHRDRALDV